MAELGSVWGLILGLNGLDVWPKLGKSGLELWPVTGEKLGLNGLSVNSVAVADAVLVAVREKISCDLLRIWGQTDQI